ncbi:MAG TPA: hypothetical protein VK308_03505, partial [Pyrinomonadaceae bacterium]|nr:hypothetical protein [Pyrinomonadaceae bacterium]
MSKEKQSRREFLKISAAGITTFGFMKNLTAEAGVFGEPHTELNELTIFELQAKMKSGELSAR